MYSQANVREESVLRPPTRALPSVIVDTEEKVLREADGLEESDFHQKKSASGGKVIAPGCASKSRRGARRSQAYTWDALNDNAK